MGLESNQKGHLPLHSLSSKTSSAISLWVIYLRSVVHGPDWICCSVFFSWQRITSFSALFCRDTSDLSCNWMSALQLQWSRAVDEGINARKKTHSHHDNCPERKRGRAGVGLVFFFLRTCFFPILATDGEQLHARLGAWPQWRYSLLCLPSWEGWIQAPWGVLGKKTWLCSTRSVLNMCGSFSGCVMALTECRICRCCSLVNSN